MHPIQLELNRLIDVGLPGAFAYLEEAAGTSQFYTAGLADHATQRRMTPDSRYRVGSTTKTFTAVVTLQLVAEGKLDLHDTLLDRLPRSPYPQRQFLDH